MMKTSLLFAAVFILLAGGKAMAVEPAIVNYNSDASWSKAVYNKFDGYTVYDRHKTSGYDIASSWSKKGIKFTVTKTIGIQRAVQDPPLPTFSHTENCYKDSKGERQCVPAPPSLPPIPQYDYYETKYRASDIMISINNRTYRYFNGSVSPELSKALASAPLNKNVAIKLSLPESPIESEIGAGTVQAWRQIFK
jgi:hypothetical protein